MYNVKAGTMDQLSTVFSKDELLILNNALNEVLNGPAAIGDWEFHTRMGVTRSEATQLLEKVSKLYGTL